MVTKLVSEFVGSKAYIIKNNSNEALIIDAGVNACEIKKHLNGEKVVGILLTHLHFDHSYYLRELIKEFGCKAYVSINAKKYLNNAEDLTLANAFGLSVQLPTELEFVNNQEIKIGNFIVKVLLTAGHSPDSVCYLIGSMLFSGDTLFLDAIGRTDFKLSSVSDMLNSLKVLKQTKFDCVLSGHGRQSGYSDQQQNINYFIELLEQIN